MIQSVIIIVFIGARCVFAVVTVFLKTGESVVATQLFVLTSYYIEMMLFQIENWYFYGLKISEPQLHWLKENHLKNLEALELLKVSPLRKYVVQSPTYSASRHASTLGWSDWTKIGKASFTISNCLNSLTIHRWQLKMLVVFSIAHWIKLETYRKINRTEL